MNSASAEGNLEVVRILLGHPDIDVNSKDKYEMSGLMWAARIGYASVADLLLEHPNIDVNAQGTWLNSVCLSNANILWKPNLSCRCPRSKGPSR